MVRERRTQVLVLGLAAALLAATWCGGCSKAPEKPKPDYADALKVYNAEMEALDRLKERREKLQSELQQPFDTDVAQQVLGQAGDLQQELLGTVQDLAKETGAKVNDETKKQHEALLDSVSQRLSQEKQRFEERRKEWEAEIAQLDKEIAEQQQRVDRAKAAREAAETTQK